MMLWCMVYGVWCMVYGIWLIEAELDDDSDGDDVTRFQELPLESEDDGMIPPFTLHARSLIE